MQKCARPAGTGACIRSRQLFLNISPILQNGCISLFLHNHSVTDNLLVDQLKQAYIPVGAKTVMAVKAGFEA